MLNRISLSWQKTPFAIPFIAATFGVCIDRFAQTTLSLWLVLAFATTMAWFAIVTRRRVITFVLLFLMTMGVFGGLHHARWHLFLLDEIGLFSPTDQNSGKPICIEAIACEQPKLMLTGQDDPLSTVPTGDRTRFQVRIRRIRTGAEWSSASGLATLTVDGHLLAVNAGDYLRIFAIIKRIGTATNPGEFDFRTHARSERRLCQLRAPYPDCVTVVQSAHEQSLYQALQRIRGRCQQAFDSYLGRSTSELAAALLLGQRDQLPRDRIDDFFLTGTMHLLAISGLHVGILAFGFFFLARRGLIPYRASLLSVMGFVFAYALLTEARPPVLRAAILVQVVCLSWLTRRRTSVYNSLMFAGLVILLWNPTELFRVGAQLSFLAVATLCWLSRQLNQTVDDDPLDQLIWRTRPWHHRAAVNAGRWVRNMLSASFCVWLITLPLTMARFHIVSPYAIFLNLILIFPLSLALFSGVTLLLCAEFFAPLAWPTGFVCNASLGTLQQIVAFTRDIPGSHFWVAGPGPIRLTVFYVSAMALVFSPWKPNPRWIGLLVICWFSVPLLGNSARQDEDVIEFTFVDVGHGTSVLIELPDDRNLLYDCGQLGVARSGAEAISSVLWSKRISHLDAVTISHADADHYNALPGLLERFSVGIVYVGPRMFEADSEALTELKRSLASFDIPTRTVHDGTRLDGNSRDLILRFIHPEGFPKYETDNELSLVLSVEYAARRLLLPGDIEGDGLDRLLVQPVIDYDLIMAPHHGSLRSSPQKFVEWASSEWTIISSGMRSDPKRSVQEYRALRQHVRSTALDGAVFVRLSRELPPAVSSFFDIDSRDRARRRRD